MTKEERIQYGKEAEDFLTDILRSERFEVKSLREEVFGEMNNTNLIDQMIGDISIKDVGTVDVKRGRGVITWDSSQKFRGDWFAMFPDELDRETCVMLPAAAVKSYMQKVKKSNNLKKMRDGTEYYEFPIGTLSKKEVKLNDWIKANRRAENGSKTL